MGRQGVEAVAEGEGTDKHDDGEERAENGRAARDGVAGPW